MTRKYYEVHKNQCCLLYTLPLSRRNTPPALTLDCVMLCALKHARTNTVTNTISNACVLATVAYKPNKCGA
jgi:hypothetical protein